MASFKASKEELFGAPKGGAKKSGGPAKTGHVLKSIDVKKTEKAEASIRPPTALELKQREQAHALVKEADKYAVKPRGLGSFFWSADFGRAARLLEQAATKLQAARFLQEAADVLARAAACSTKDGMHAQAMTCYQRGADLFLRLGRQAEAIALFRQVSEAALELGDAQRAADALMHAADRACKGAPDPGEALGLLREACDLVYDGTEALDPRDVGPRAHEVFVELLGKLLEADLPKEALQVCPKAGALLQANELKSSLAKVYLTEAVLEASVSGDLVKAQETFMQHLGDSDYLRTEECRCEEELLGGLRTRDARATADALQLGCLRFLHPKAAQLAHGLQIEGAESEEEEEESDEESLDLQASTLDAPAVAALPADARGAGGPGPAEEEDAAALLAAAKLEASEELYRAPGAAEVLFTSISEAAPEGGVPEEDEEAGAAGPPQQAGGSARSGPLPPTPTAAAAPGPAAREPEPEVARQAAPRNPPASVAPPSPGESEDEDEDEDLT